jgi:TrmH family RNA methyltransferase
MSISTKGAGEHAGHGAERISSLHHPSIKRVRALRVRKERDRTGECFVEGLHIVGEAVAAPAPLTSLIVAPDLLTSAFGRQLVERARRQGTPCLEVSADAFRACSTRDGPQGLGAVVRQRWQPLATLWTQPTDLWVALEAIQDPGNLGTILRTADAVGAAGAVLIGVTTDPYDPIAVRASMGAIFTQRLVRATYEEFADWRQRSRCCLLGATGSAMADYRTAAYARPLVLLLGGERQGLSRRLAALCDATARIPMVGRGDSLNVAVAASVILYEAFRRTHPA